jgi:hypothetical protein
MLVGRDGVVPLAVKRVTLDGERGHLGIGDLDALGIAVRIQLAAHRQASLRRRGADQLDNDLMADQRLAAPVLRDGGKQAVLDAVPLAGPRRAGAPR